MKQIEVVGAIIRKGDKIFATQRVEGLVGVSWRKDGGRGNTGGGTREGDSRRAVCGD